MGTVDRGLLIRDQNADFMVLGLQVQVVRWIPEIGNDIGQKMKSLLMVIVAM